MPSAANVLDRLEQADSEDLTRLILQATAPQERILRAYLGDDRFERMRRLARDANGRGSAAAARDQDTRRMGNVVVLHGIMGADIETLDNHTGVAEHVWIHYWRILRGNLRKLRLGIDGEREADLQHTCRASGIMKKHYGETLLSLSSRYHVRPFWYDWRKDLRIAARELHSFLEQNYRAEYVHLVAHSMGGLVARTFIQAYPEHWKRLAPHNGPDATGGRLVMLGTPNHGSFAIPQIITGIEPMVDKLATLDLWHDLRQLLDIVNTFPGSYQMLPSPLIKAEFERLYKASTYAPVTVAQSLLDNARQHHDDLAPVVDPARMVYVAGYDQDTFDRMSDYERPGDRKAYGATRRFGDGRVPHDLGFLTGVTNYFVRESHGSLQVNKLVLDALPDLLDAGRTDKLAPQMPSGRGAPTTAEDNREALRNAERLWSKYDTEVAESKRVLRHARRNQESRQAAAVVARSVAAGDGAPTGSTGSILSPPAPVASMDGTRPDSAAAVQHEPVAAGVAEAELTRDASGIQDEVTRGFLGNGSLVGRSDDPDADASDNAFDEIIGDPVPLTVDVTLGSIEEAGTHAASGTVDAVAVGNYLNVRPQDAILALDRAISASLPLRAKTDRNAGREHLLLTQYVERGVIRGELGQTFLIPDPRRAERVVAVAGMGLVGRFRAPELVVLARELCWALGRLGRRHLATVLIGSGRGNLSVEDAVESWVEGLAAALRGGSREQHGRLTAITFVERDAERAEQIAGALTDTLKRRGSELPLRVTNHAADRSYAAAIRQQRKSKAARAARTGSRASGSDAVPSGSDAVPTRMTLTRERGTYRFGAITPDASIPEREVTLDPRLVEEANCLLSTDPRDWVQLENGQLVGKLLLPKDLRGELFRAQPLVMMLDPITARIHWEMVARFDLPTAVAPGSFRYRDHFLGTGLGLTRQLRTTFAPPPEPPPPARRMLRVLVVADPAEDAPLMGAREEGDTVADLFEAFNGQGGPNRVYVRRLIGPRQATRVNVLRELLVRTPAYDVLHFAGHCFFDPADPGRSGWIFSKGECITAAELNRIDRIPAFVFSNACESGITSERKTAATPGLAPSFAEAFFGCGVSNFMCTAWPVDDSAAKAFALRLYGELLGFPRSNAAAGRRPAHLYEALRDARLEIAGTPAGALTWGAYQHYGNPFYRFFGEDGPDQSTQGASPTPNPTSNAGPKSKQRKAPPAGGKPRRRAKA